MTALAILTRYWREAAIAALGVIIAALLLINAHAATRLADCKRRSAETQAAYDATVANYRATTLKAQADDLAHAREVETRNAAATQETEHDLQTKLADARAVAAAYADRLRAASAAHSGSGGQPGMSGSARAASAVDAAGEAPVMDADDGDEVICAENTVKAQGWQDWWAKVETAQ